MDSLYLLLPLSVLLVLALIALFAWALESEQFEDLEREGERLLADDAAGPALAAAATVPSGTRHQAEPSGS